MTQVWKLFTCPKCKKVYTNFPPFSEGKDDIDSLTAEDFMCPDCKVPYKTEDWEAVKHFEFDDGDDYD